MNHGATQRRPRATAKHRRPRAYYRHEKHLTERQSGRAAGGAYNPVPFERDWMNVIRTDIPDVLIVEPKVFGDERGFFFESFNARAFAEKTGVTANFVQDNHSRSGRGVLRGLHYQLQQAQGK